MNNEITKTINEIIKLLQSCGWNNKAEWFVAKLHNIQRPDLIADDLRNELYELNKIVSGIGSFDDLPLNPKDGSGLSKQNARLKQTELAVRLRKAIDEVLS